MRNRSTPASLALLLLLSLAGAVPISTSAQQPERALPVEEAEQPRRAERVEQTDRKLNVLILADSLALCGFGKRLDERFRADPKFNATFTYMACGTNPISWLKQPPYTNVKTQCGFWTIESVPGSAEPREMRDTYGIKRGQAPKAHTVPKFEDLLPVVQPDIVVIQTGSNLFGLFPDAKTVRAAKDASTLKKYLTPFAEKVISPPSKVAKIYYVNPPTSGRVSKEIQDFVYQQVKAQLGEAATVIDSRKLVTYPYQQMEPDKEHFLGPQMDEWADKVFDIVQADLAKRPLTALRPLHETIPTFWAVAAPGAGPAAEESAPAPAAADQALTVEAKLIFKSEPMEVRELLPYRESLVSFVYEVKRVIRGRYSEKQILVMHPSHIALKRQPLEKYRVGLQYKLRLEPMEGSPWETAKMRDDSGQINLQPFIRAEDKRKHPATVGSALTR